MRSSLYCRAWTSASIFSEICPEPGKQGAGRAGRQLLAAQDRRRQRRRRLERTSSYSSAVREALQSSRMLRSLILETKCVTSSSSL